MPTSMNWLNRQLFVLIAAWLAVATSFFLCVSVSVTSITSIVGALLILGASDWRYIKDTWLNNPIALGLIVIFLMYVFAGFYSQGSIHQITHDIYKHKWIIYALCFMLIFKDDTWRQRIINAFLLSMIFVMVLSYLKWFGLVDPPPYIREPASVFLQHIAQNFLMAVAAILLAYRFIYYSKNKVLYAVLFLLASYNVLFVSSGRTGYVIYAVLLLYLAHHRFGIKGVLASILVVAVLSLAAYNFSTSFNTRVSQAINNVQKYHAGQTQTSVGIRMAMAHDSINMIKQHPWFGVGTGGILHAYHQLPNSMLNQSRVRSYIELGFLQVLLTFGIVGFLIFMTIMAMQFYYSFRLPHEFKFTMQVVLIGYWVGAVGNPFFISHSQSLLYALFLAAMFSTLPVKQLKQVQTEADVVTA